MEQVSYVVGFMFSIDLKQVALIKKNRPERQAGFLNGIGGHVEPSDASIETAMSREFFEETGVSCSTWTGYARISLEGQFKVTFFFTKGDLRELKTTTDEEVVIVNTADIQGLKAIDNLSWLIPLAIDCITDGQPGWTETNYTARGSS